MTAQATVERLVELLDHPTPFLHTRFGDGDVFFATGTGPQITGDGEEWSPLLAAKLMVAWNQFIYYDYGPLLLGDLETYDVSDGCEKEWGDLVFKLDCFRGGRGEVEWAHMEALRVGYGVALPVYEAIRDFPGEKLYVCPERLKPMADLLNCHHMPCDLGTAHHLAVSRAEAIDAYPERPQLALFSAGRGGKIMQGHLAEIAEDIAQIDIGSGLDLLIDDGVRRGTDLRVDRSKVLREYREAGLAA